MRMIRRAAWAAIAACVVAVGVFGSGDIRSGDETSNAARSIGGPFALTTHEGKRLSSDALGGTPFAIFFGFTVNRHAEVPPCS